MRARIYKLENGTMDVFLEPSVGKGRPPVLLKNVTPEDVVGRVLPEIERMRQPKGSSPPTASSG